MGLILRPVKQFGFREYTDDFAAAPINPTPPPTHLYVIQTAEVDGDFDTIYTLVNGSLDDANIAVGANINGAKLAALSVTGTQIANLTVTTGKLAVTSSTPNAVSVAGLVVSITTEADVAVLAPITTRGGNVLLTGNVAMVCLAGGGSAVTLRVYRDGSIINTTKHTIAGTVPVPCPAHVDLAPGAGAHTYKFTAEVTGGGSLVTDATDRGIWHAIEFA